MGEERIRSARPEDLDAIVAMLADDPLGASRERTGEDLDAYRDALREITADPAHQVLVVELDGAVVGVLQLSFLRCLTHGGGRRAQIEGVRIAAGQRGAGLGEVLIGEAVRQARAAGCHLVQLTTDRRRPRALAFYQRLGFVDSHHGMKRDLSGDGRDEGG